MNHSIRVRRRPRRARPPTARTAAAIVATAALVTLAAACGGSPSSAGSGSSPSSAGSGGSSNAGGSANSPLLAFSQCMRSHSVPNFPDPPAGATNAKFPSSGQLGVSGSVYQTALNTCDHLLPAGVDGQFPPAEIPLLLSDMREFSQCMRSHGVPNWPDPTSDSQGHVGFNLVGINGLNSDSPKVQATANECQHLLPPQLGGIPVSRD
jgi:hypothetical protein